MSYDHGLHSLRVYTNTVNIPYGLFVANTVQYIVFHGNTADKARLVNFTGSERIIT